MRIIVFHLCYNRPMGMIGFDGSRTPQTASREAPNSINPRNYLGAERTDYAALPLAA